MGIRILLYALCSFSLLQQCSCGNTKTSSVLTARGVNGQGEEAGIVYVEEQDLPFQRTPVTMDLSNPNPELFEVEGEREGEGIYSGAINPLDEYCVTRIKYGDKILWVSRDDWECTHAEIYTTKDKVLIMAQFQRGGEIECEAVIRRQEDGSWEEVDIAESSRLILEIMVETEMLRTMVRRKHRGMLYDPLNYFTDFGQTSDLERIDPKELKRPYRLKEMEKIRAEKVNILGTFKIVKRNLLEFIRQMGVMTFMLTVDGISQLGSIVLYGYNTVVNSVAAITRIIRRP